MSLLHKVRTLIGALVHAPLAPGPPKTEPEEHGTPAAPGGVVPRPGGLERREQDTMDDSRVADVIARRREGGEQ
jgi:hypothetical protein